MALSTIETSRLLASDGVNGDNFGSSVAIDGAYAIVGTYIYKNSGDGAFIEIGKIAASDVNVSSSVAISGDHLIIGATGDDEQGVNAGAVYLFKNIGGDQFVQKAKITASDGRSGNHFGEEVALNEERTIMAVISLDTLTREKSVYIFKVDEHGDFLQTDKLNVPGEFFGHKVAISGAYLIVSSSPDDAIVDQPAYIFKDDGSGVFTQIDRLYGLPREDQGSWGEKYGSSVAISGDLAIVGARGDDDFYGKAYLYQNDGTDNFDQIAILTPSVRTPGDRFGWSVAIKDDNVIVGAHSHGMENYWGSHANAKGAAFIFQEDEDGHWSELAKLTASNGAGDDHFGKSVAVSSEFALIGAPNNDAKGKNAGAAYLFYLKDKVVPVIAYKIQSFSGRSSNKLKAIITLCDTEAIARARIMFYNDEADIPASDIITPYGLIECHYKAEQYAEVVDLLRNEEPVYININRFTNVAHLSTRCEPVGELESYPRPNVVLPRRPLPIR